MFNNIFPMTHDRRTSRKKGFISSAAVLVVLTSLGVVMTLMYRSTQGQLLVKNVKQGNQAFQQSDSNTEVMLQNFWKVDQGSAAVNGIDTSKKIPSNITAWDFCQANNVRCWKSISGVLTEITSSADTTKLSEVVSVSAQGDSGAAGSIVRSVQAPVLNRVTRPDFAIKTASSTTALTNSNNVQVTWTIPTGTAATDIDAIEIRRASSKDSSVGGISCGTAGSCDDVSLSNTGLNWIVIARVKLDGTKCLTATGEDMPECPSSVTLAPVSGSTVSLVDNDSTKFPAGTKLAYIIKATNKNPLNLDSPYSDKKEIKIHSVGDPTNPGNVTDLIGGSLTEDESCKTDLGMLQSPAGSCLSSPPAGAKGTNYFGYDGFDGVTAASTPYVNGLTGNAAKGVALSSQYTCHSGKGCYRCPDDGVVATSGNGTSYSVAEWWRNYTWAPYSSTTCVQKCNSGPAAVDRGSISKNCEERPGLTRIELQTVANDPSLTPVRLVVNSSGAETTTAAAGNKYCYVADKNQRPSDSTVSANRCNVANSFNPSGRQVLGTATPPSYLCSEPGTTLLYTSDTVHPGVVDTRTSCITCAVKHGNNVNWVYRNIGNPLDNCIDVTPTLSISSSPATLSSDGGNSTITWTLNRLTYENGSPSVTCTASGDWSGSKTIGGSYTGSSESVYLSANSTQSGVRKTYRMTCTNNETGVSVTQSTDVIVRGKCLSDTLQCVSGSSHSGGYNTCSWDGNGNVSRTAESCSPLACNNTGAQMSGFPTCGSGSTMNSCSYNANGSMSGRQCANATCYATNYCAYGYSLTSGGWCGYDTNYWSSNYGAVTSTTNGTCAPIAPTPNPSAWPSTVSYGGSATLYWNTQYASVCEISGVGTYGAGTTSYTFYNLISSGTYWVHCLGTYTGTWTGWQPVNITVTTPQPYISFAYFSPSYMAKNNSSRFYWASSNTDMCYVSGVGYYATYNYSGVSYFFSSPGSYTYYLSCRSAYNSSVWTAWYPIYLTVY